MNGHDVIWSRPPALLTRDTARIIPSPREAFRAPAILRFSNDSFMQEFLDTLQTDPSRLREYQVRRETWRGFVAMPAPETPKASSLVLQRLGIVRRGAATAVGVAPPAPPVPAGMPLKLYQPAHQRYYLVVSSLVCNVTGLPDRVVEAGQGERTAFVVRRLLPPSGEPETPVEAWHEHAWVAGEQGNTWRPVGADLRRLVGGEERVPLFTAHFAEGERRRRRLFAGVIPVGKREIYLGAPKSSGSGAPGVTSRTSRKVVLRKDVIEPWKALVRRAQETNRAIAGPFIPGDEAPNDTERAARVKLEREQIQTVSWLILLDFARYLAAHLKPVWRAVLDPPLSPTLTTPERAVFDALNAATISLMLRQRLRRRSELSASGEELYSLDNVPASLREALARYGTGTDGLNTGLEQSLERVDQAYDRYTPQTRALWPAFLFPLADPDLPTDAPLPPIVPLATLTTEEQSELALDEDPQIDDSLERLDKLTVLVLRALRDDEAEPAPRPAVPSAAVQPANPLEGWFVVRCVYERPACEPLHGAVLSDPTEPFQMAGFFDPDAPARPIRIGLPIDTTPAGLRKFDKNTAFVISDTLCGQIRRMKGMTLGDLVRSVLPWPLHKDLPGLAGDPCRTDSGLSLGMICSISIPIITLCALFMLMIMVSLLDFIFRWMPWFIICFPVPGLKAKK